MLAASQTGALPNESALLRAAKKGDVCAFDQLTRNYEKSALKLAFYIARNSEDAEDIVQESLLKAFKGLPQFREESKFYTWFSRIVVNHALMKLRRQRRQKMVPIEIDTEQRGSLSPMEIVDPGPSPEDRVMQQEMGRRLTKAVGELPLPARNVFVMRVMEGRSINETAETLKISVPLVKTRLFRARLELQRCLTFYFANCLSRPKPGTAITL
jgi:RNA polymerase sigma-70 factor, ECF subfamily